MRRLRHATIGILYAVLLCACEGTSFQNSVPRYPVNIVINTESGAFVHFKPEALNTYIIVDKEGYHYNGILYPRTVVDAYGYGGVVVYIDMFNTYHAFDLACPYCAGRGKRQSCEIDAPFAICPNCGERYDLGSGTAAPQKGIAREYMLSIPLQYNGSRLTIRQ